MTVQFNLLPDIKIEYLKAKRQQHVVMLVSIVVSIAALVVFGLLASVVYGVQRKNLSDLNHTIKSKSNDLRNTTDLDKILTIQNQLKSLPGLHDSKVVSSALFNYLSQLTPVDASISRLNVDFTANTMSISGDAKDLATVNTYIDTLKFTAYTSTTETVPKVAFSNVVLATFSRTDKLATYTIDLAFDAKIFSEKEVVTLVVPNTITTRSVIDQPKALFKQSAGGN